MKALTRVRYSHLSFLLFVLLAFSCQSAQAEDQTPRARLNTSSATNGSPTTAVGEKKIPEQPKKSADEKNSPSPQKAVAKNVVLMMLGISQSAHRR